MVKPPVVVLVSVAKGPLPPGQMSLHWYPASAGVAIHPSRRAVRAHSTPGTQYCDWAPSDPQLALLLVEQPASSKS